MHYARNRIPIAYWIDSNEDPHRNASEHIMQSHVVQDARLLWPELLMIHIPMNQDSIGSQAKMKRMGALAGTPDLLITNRTAQYTCMFLELKRCGGSVSVPQQRMLATLSDAAHGCFCVVAFGYREAMTALAYYMELVRQFTHYRPTPLDLDAADAN
jgi:hypothetical protein